MPLIQLTRIELVELTAILSSIETHIICKNPGSETHHYYPKFCLEGITSRFLSLNGKEILNKLEQAQRARR